MTVHELYSMKQKEYQKYTVETEFYNKEMAKLVEQLHTEISSLEEVSTNLTNGALQQRVLQVIKDLRASPDLKADKMLLDRSLVSLQDITQSLTNEIERVLNE